MLYDSGEKERSMKINMIVYRYTREYDVNNEKLCR